MTKSIPGNLHRIPISHQELLDVDGNNQDPILIVGMHNSGTSILAKILHESGVFLGNNMGHYESHFFSIFVNDLLIMQGGNNWAKLPLLSIDEVMSFRDTVGPFVKRHWVADYLQWGYDGFSMWGIKDPRLCVLLPLYLDIFPKATVVHIRRNPNDVAASLSSKSKRGVGKYDDFEHWRKVTLKYTDRVVSYADKARAYHEIQYEEFCTASEDVVQNLFAFLDLAFTKDTKKLLTEVSPARIGSYQRYQKNKTEHGIKKFSKSLLYRNKYRKSQT